MLENGFRTNFCLISCDSFVWNGFEIVFFASLRTLKLKQIFLRLEIVEQHSMVNEMKITTNGIETFLT